MKNSRVKMNEERNLKIEKKTKKSSKNKKDFLDYGLLALSVLMILEFLMIPCFVYAGMNQIFTIIMFILLPTLFALTILLLSRNTIKELKKRAKNKAASVLKEAKKEPHLEESVE